MEFVSRRGRFSKSLFLQEAVSHKDHEGTEGFWVLQVASMKATVIKRKHFTIDIACYHLNVISCYNSRTSDFNSLSPFHCGLCVKQSLRESVVFLTETTGTEGFWVLQVASTKAAVITRKHFTIDITYYHSNQKNIVSIHEQATLIAYLCSTAFSA